ncbi:MAG: DUF4266 domain-containing protein [Candidatus Eisenbacteria bacterium]
MRGALLHAAATMVLFAALLATGGCAATAVKPWDRDLLAQPRMRLNPRPLETAVDDHVYFSKEGSTGSMDVAGGGCGCN